MILPKVNEIYRERRTQKTVIIIEVQRSFFSIPDSVITFRNLRNAEVTHFLLSEFHKYFKPLEDGAKDFS
jgi:hypothetical protein